MRCLGALLWRARYVQIGLMSELSSLPTDPESSSDSAAGATELPQALSTPGKRTIGAVVIVLLALVAYWPLHTAGYIWDDGGWLVHNHFVHHWRGLWNIWFNPHDSIQYYPMVFTAFNLQWHIWGGNALGYHVLNIIMQAVNAVFLWRILKALKLRSAWIAAAIWAIHPVQVETVGWVVEQKNLLSAMFLFPAVLIWTGFADLEGKRGAGEPFLTVQQWRKYALATLLFVLALCSKSDACIVPVVLLFVLGWKREYIKTRDVLLLLPWMVFGFLSALMTIYIEHSQVGAKGHAFQFTIAQHLIIAGKDLWFYPFKLFWPWPMMAVYPRWHVSHVAAWEWVFPITAFAIPLVLLALSRKIGRGPFVAVCVYGLMISPLLGFIAFYTEVYTFVADHYQYLACIGIIVLATEVVAEVVSRVRRSDRNAEKMALPAEGSKAPIEAKTNGGFGHRLGAAVSVLVLLALGTMTWAQSQIYTPPLRVWTHNIKCNPDCWLAMERVGVHEYGKGHVSAALVLFERAQELSHGTNLIVNANLGDLYRHLGQYAKAIPYYRRSLAVAGRQPPIIAHLVDCYEKVGDWRQAYIDLLHGVKLLPHSADLQTQLAAMLAKAGHPRQAVPHFMMAVKYEPADTRALFGLAESLAALGEWQKAIPYFQRALKASPDFGQGHFAYGVVLLQHGQPALAAEQFHTVLALGRELRVEHNTLGKHFAPDPWRIQTHQALAAAYAAGHHPRRAAKQKAIVKRLVQRQQHWAEIKKHVNN